MIHAKEIKADGDTGDKGCGSILPKRDASSQLCLLSEVQFPPEKGMEMTPAS